MFYFLRQSCTTHIAQAKSEFTICPELASDLQRPCLGLLSAGTTGAPHSDLWKVTYLHITLHKRIPDPGGLNQRTDICRCLAALAKHGLGFCSVGVIILICSKVRDSEVHLRELLSRAQGWWVTGKL